MTTTLSPVPASGPSPDGAVVPTTTTAIRDYQNNLWTIDYRNRVILNDKALNSTKGAKQILWYHGTLYYQR